MVDSGWKFCKNYYIGDFTLGFTHQIKKNTVTVHLLKVLGSRVWVV